ncbi:MAG: hypothetical protein WCK98_05055 [bacterium]
MSNKTLVLYLENETLKSDLQRQASSQNISLSKYVSKILADSLKTKQLRNLLLKYKGGLKNIPTNEWQEINQNMKNFRKSFDLNFDKMNHNN